MAMIDIRKTALPEILEIFPVRHRDERGFFSETSNRADLRAAGIDIDWVQDNHTLSYEVGVLRGLHYQAPPFAQDKLVRVTCGAILDIAVDIRSGSPNFARYVAIELSAEKWNQLLIPKGFAHGYLTLTPMAEVLYKVSNHYSKPHDRVIRFDDPDIDIDWPFADGQPKLSNKDATATFLKEQDPGFVYID